MNVRRIRRDLIDPDPSQPRREFPPAKIDALAGSLRKFGQQVPIIVCPQGARFLIVDGGFRYQAAGVAELVEMDAVVIDKKPSPSELLALQLTCNCLRTDLAVLDRLAAYQRLMQTQNWNATQLAEALFVSKATVSATLALAKLSEEERAQIARGELSLSGGYALARMTAEQRAALPQNDAGKLTRDQLQTAARQRPARGATKTARLTCRLPSAEIVVATSEEVDLDRLVGILQELLRECRKARGQGLDVRTAVRVWQDRAAKVGRQ